MSYPHFYKAKQARDAAYRSFFLQPGDSFARGFPFANLIDSMLDLGGVAGGSFNGLVLETPSNLAVAGGVNTYNPELNTANEMAGDEFACSLGGSYQQLLSDPYETDSDGGMINWSKRSADTESNSILARSQAMKMRLLYYADENGDGYSNRDIDIYDGTTNRGTVNLSTGARLQRSVDSGDPDTTAKGSPHLGKVNAIFGDKLIEGSGFSIRDTLLNGTGGTIDTGLSLPIVGTYSYAVDGNGDPELGTQIHRFGAGSYQWANYFNAATYPGGIGAAWKNILYDHLLSAIDCLVLNPTMQPFIMPHLAEEYDGDNFSILDKVDRFRKVFVDICAAIGLPTPVFCWVAMFNHLISGEDDEPDGRSRHNDWGKMLFSIASDYGDSFVSLLAPQQGTRINGSDAAVDYLASIGGTSYSYGAATAAPSSRNLITTDGADLLDSGEIHADTYYQYINGQIIADALNSPDESFSYDEVTLKASAVGATLADFVFHYDLSRCTEKWWSLVDDNGRMISVVSGSGIADIPFHLVNFDKANKKGAIRFRTDVSGNFDKTVRIYPALPSLNSMPEHSNGSEAVYPSTVLHYGYLNGTAFPIGRPWIDGTSNGLNGTITAFSDSIVETNEIAGLDAFSNFANDENYQEYISLTDIPTTVLPLSVLIVFKPNLLNSSQALFSLANGSSNVQQLKVETLNTNKVRAVHRNTSNANGAISTTDAQLDAWNHAAAEFTAATRSIWLNGTDKVTETAARTMFTATTCTFGAVDRDADDDLFFKGAIAAVEVRSGALSDEFVALHAKMFLAPDDVYESAVFRQVSGTIGEGRLVRRLVGRVSRGLTR